MTDITKQDELNFGDVVENGWASDSNPHKRGYFIRYATRQRQKCAELTDGKGEIWHCPLKDNRLSKVADSPFALARTKMEQ